MRRVCPYCGHEIEVVIHVILKREYRDLREYTAEVERI